MTRNAAPDANTLLQERFCLLGDVGDAAFPVWIARHARRLGIESRLVSQDAGVLELVVTGPAALLDAMALGCSLGPQEVLVDVVQREESRLPPGESSSLPA